MMDKDFRGYITQVLSNALYFAAKERFERVAVKVPQIGELGQTEYLKEAWALSEKYAKEAVSELEQMGIQSAEDMTQQQKSNSLAKKLKEVQSRMERELSQ